jgi:hypothetical protein
MSVSGLSTTGDWRFGQGRAVYLKRSDEIRQNVITRLRSFADDWFADIDAGLPWLDMLGAKNNEARILREVESTVLRTSGVQAIERLELVGVTMRDAEIRLTVRDIFGAQLTDTVGVIV